MDRSGRGPVRPAGGGGGREDCPEGEGAEVSRDIGGVGGGGALLQCAGELPAVVDQRAQQPEEASGAGGCVSAGGRPILVRIGAVGFDGAGRGGHGRNMNLCEGSVARNIFRGAAAAPGGYG